MTRSVYVADADAVFARAVAAAAVEQRPVADQFYGDRSDQFEDPFGQTLERGNPHRGHR